MIGNLPGWSVHWGLAIGLCLLAAALRCLRHTTLGFSMDILGGNRRAAQMAGLPIGRLMLLACLIGGAAAGSPARSRSSRCTERRANRSLSALATPASLVAFSGPAECARRYPRGAAAWRHLSERRPAAAPLRHACCNHRCLQGLIFICVLASNALAGRLHGAGERDADAGDLGWWGVALAIVAGAIRVSTPYLLVSLGEALTEKSGRVNLGLEGTLVMGAMSGFATSSLTGSPWLGVLAAGLIGAALGFCTPLSAICRESTTSPSASPCSFSASASPSISASRSSSRAPRCCRDCLSGSGATIRRSAPPSRSARCSSSALRLRSRFEWGLANTRWGLILRMAGESADAARASASRSSASARPPPWAAASCRRRRRVSVALLSGQLERGPVERPGPDGDRLGHFRALEPDALPLASLLFGGASAIGPALQTVGITEGYYLFYAAPYVLTLGLLIYSSSRRRTLAGAPSELSISR